MRQTDTLPADSVPEEKRATNGVRRPIDRQLVNAGLMCPALLHFAVGVAISVVAAFLSIVMVWNLLFRALDPLDDTLFVAVGFAFAIYLCLAFCLQLVALFRCSRLAALFSAAIQGLPGLLLSFLPALLLIDWFQSGFEAIDRQQFAISFLPVLFLIGGVLNLRWHLRLSDNEISPGWLRRYQLSELAAITTGACLAAATIAPFFNQ